MRDLTWFFVVAVATCFVCLLLTGPSHGDDFAAHLKALQEKNAARPKPVEAPKFAGWQTGDRSFYRGKWWTLRADGWWYADPAILVQDSVEFPQLPPQVPTYYQQPARAFRFFGGSSCGPSG